MEIDPFEELLQLICPTEQQSLKILDNTKTNAAMAISLFITRCESKASLEHLKHVNESHRLISRLLAHAVNPLANDILLVTTNAIEV